MRYLLRRILQSVLLPFGLIVLFATVTCGQEYSYARYDVKDGLAGSVVYCATEDRDGFLWFGTETGLSRFDGTHFKNFTTADGLPDNEILYLFADSRGRVWISSFSNAICFYYKGKIHNQQNDSLLSRLKISSNILNVAEDRDGCIAVLEAKALHTIRLDGEIITLDGVREQKISSTTTLWTDAQGVFQTMIYFYDTSSVDRLREYMLYVRHGKLESEEPLPRNTLSAYNSAYVSSRLKVTKHQDGKLRFVQWPAKKETTLTTPADYVSISFINDSTYTVNSADGSLFYDPGKGIVFRHCLKGRIINAVFKDSEDNHWFASQGAGIFRISSFDFTNLIFSESRDNYNTILSINRIDSSLYAGSEKAMLYKIDVSNKGPDIKKLHLNNEASNIKIISIMQFSGGATILGTNLGLKNLKTADHKFRIDSAISIKSICLYKDSILASTHMGVFLGGQSLKFDLERVRVLYRGRATCAYGRNDTFYVGTLGGLYRVTGNLPPVFLGNQYPVFKSRITDIKEGPDGTFWIATNGNGLAGYRNNQIVWQANKQDGLTSDICRTIYIAGQDIWVGTERGLNRIQLKKKEGYAITTFTSSDGLIDDIVNAIYVEGNDVYVGTPAGLTYFDASKISLHSSCKLRVTGIRNSHNNWSYDTSGFVLSHADNDVRIDYVGISYRSAGDITYRYRLSGLNDNWQTTRETFISYPSLPSGDYELQLTAVNKFGVESEMVRLPFSIEKLLWEKNWFRILALIAICGIVWFLVSLRIKKIRLQNDEKTQMNDRMTELEQMALKAQMNPHFIFNSLNSVQHYVIEKDILGANKFITEFSRLIRMTLDISSKTSISLYEEISYLTTYLELEKTKFENKFSYEIDLVTDLDPSAWYIPPMILQPYVENSIRHGVRNRTDNKGYIRIQISSDLIYLVFSIEDNGVGREVAASYKSQLSIEYQSKGMTLTAKRIEMLNKGQQAPVLIEVEDLYRDNAPTGTRVILKFPLVDADKND